MLSFWLEETPEEKRFARDQALDAEIRRRFGAVTEAALDGARPFADDPVGVLATVILLDQFARNLHRGEARAFAGDAGALALAKSALDRRWDRGMSADARQFLYMPLMHSESADDQVRSVQLFEALGKEDAAHFARLHRDVIARFGRFPARNAALGRETTPEEAKALAEEEIGF